MRVNGRGSLETRPSTPISTSLRFWTAWERGAATTVDIVAADWDFWDATPVPLEELRAAYGVPPVDPAMLA